LQFGSWLFEGNAYRAKCEQPHLRLSNAAGYSSGSAHGYIANQSDADSGKPHSSFNRPFILSGIGALRPPDATVKLYMDITRRFHAFCSELC
jgi:hypothetical protein